MRAYSKPINLKEYSKLEDSQYVKMPTNNLIKTKISSKIRVDQSDYYICGMDALNIVSIALDYEKQWRIKNYPYQGIGRIRWGLSGYKFAQKLIYDHYDTYTVYCGPKMPWDVLE